MLRAAHMLAAYDVPDLVRDHVAAFGGVDAVCYLADLQQAVLVPFLGPEGLASVSRSSRCRSIRHWLGACFSILMCSRSDIPTGTRCCGCRCWTAASGSACWLSR